MEQLIVETTSRHMKDKLPSVVTGLIKGKLCLTICDEMTAWVGQGRTVEIVYLDSRLWTPSPQKPDREADEAGMG